MTETSIAESRTADAGVAARYQEPSSARRWVARVAVLLPIVVAVVLALVNGWFPVGDAALLAIRAYDVGTPDHPLLGSWTSASFALGIDVNNPGPLYPDLLAPFMWTIGRANPRRWWRSRVNRLGAMNASTDATAVSSSPRYRQSCGGRP